MGDNCFKKAEELKLIGLHTLERVLIGKGCFTMNDYDPNKDRRDPNRHFYLKDCEQLKKLKIGPNSFEDYAVCEIANVPSLEVIKIGELNEESDNFWYASLELKSAGDEMK